MRKFEVFTIHHKNGLQHQMAVVEAVSFEVALQRTLDCSHAEVLLLERLDVAFLNGTLLKVLYVDLNADMMFLVKLVD